MAMTNYERLKRYRQLHGYDANTKYQKEKTKSFHLTFYNTTDADVIAKLNSVDNRTDYIRQLILRDIETNA